jgi:hypothetical protein
MSHPSCLEGPESASAAESVPPPEAPERAETPRQAGAALLRDPEGKPVGGGVSYECVNDCVSSQGVTALLSGATISLGCLMAPPACPVFIGSGVGLMLGACEVACENLESKP